MMFAYGIAIQWSCRFVFTIFFFDVHVACKLGSTLCVSVPPIVLQLVLVNLNLGLIYMKNVMSTSLMQFFFVHTSITDFDLKLDATNGILD